MDKIPQGEKVNTQSNIILNTNHPLEILILSVVIILALSMTNAYRYLQKNTIIKEINDFTLFFSIIYAAYKLFFIYASPQAIGTIQEINKDLKLLPLTFQISSLIFLFNKAFISIIDITQYYMPDKIKDKEIENKDDNIQENVIGKTFSIALIITLCHLFLKKISK